MNDVLDVVAGVALPVAVVLVVLALAAFVVVQADLGDERTRGRAGRSFEPLAVCGGIAAVVDVIALVISGDGGPLSVALALALMAGAVGLWAASETPDLDASGEFPRVEPEPEPARPAPVPTRPASLWADPSRDPEPRR